MSQIPAHKHKRVVRKGGSKVIKPNRKKKSKRKPNKEVVGDANQE